MRKRFLGFSALCLCFLLPLTDVVSAEGISGSLELDYGHLNIKSTDETEESVRTKSDNFTQKYNLHFDRALYPNVKLSAGGIFQKISGKFETDGIETDSTLTRFVPSVDLRMANPFINAGIGFIRSEEKQTSGRLPSTTNMRDSFSASLGLRPLDLPALNMHFLRAYTYDKERISRDSINDSFSASLMYNPTKHLQLGYQGRYNNGKNRLTDLETQSLAHTARASYSRNFFNRVSLSTSYRFNTQESKTTTSGKGNVSFQLSPFSGLSAISDTPTQTSLEETRTLTDGDAVAISGINIGPVPIGGNNKLRNIGLDFVNDSEVNTLFLWVDRQLPDIVVNSFSWDIYTSSDNQNWAIIQTVSPATFGPFDNKFVINFNTVKTRFIKVVTRPLSTAIAVPPGFDVSNIFVTELQAFITKPAADVSSSFSSSSHNYDLNVRTKILDSPSLYYDFTYFYTRTEPSGISRYSLINGLSMSHKISRIFSTSARVSREDSEVTGGTKVTYGYSASLTAVPLKTLNHILVLSGRYETMGEESSYANSAYLVNSVQFYKGVSFGLSGGLSTSTSETGRKSEASIVNFGATLDPFTDLSINLGYSNSELKQTGAHLPETSSFTRTKSLSVSYSPFRTVYLFASIGILQEKDKETGTTRDFAVTWSPFRDGALQLNILYSHTISSPGDAKLTSFIPSLRWNIARRTYLNFAYQLFKEDSATQTTDTAAYSTSLRTSF